LGGWVGSEKPDRSWGVGEFRGKVRNKAIKSFTLKVKVTKVNRYFWDKAPN